MYLINKSFDFSYGHRVWNQELSSGVCKCRWLHGHNGVIKVDLMKDELVRGMVLDYNELKFIKEFIDEFLDHRMIMDIHDPMLPMLVRCRREELTAYADRYKFFKVKPDERALVTNEMKELYESLTIVHFVPTSENICKAIYEGLDAEGIPVVKVSFKETDKTEAMYIGENRIIPGR